MQEDIDNDLLELFQRCDRKLPAEPFLTDTQRHIESIRFRRTFVRRFLQFLGIIGIALASPWLIEGSVLLSSGLDFVFAEAARLLGTRLGTLVAVLLSIPVIVWNRKRIF